MAHPILWLIDWKVSRTKMSQKLTIKNENVAQTKTFKTQKYHRVTKNCNVLKDEMSQKLNGH